MGTIMWRLRDRFINLEGLGYWPLDVANERCGYTPDLGEKATTSLREEKPSPGGRARSIGSTFEKVKWVPCGNPERAMGNMT